jgi:integrase
MSKHTVHSYMRANNHFLGWAGREGVQVTAKAQLPRLPKQLVGVLCREEIAAMEDAAQTERDRIIVRTLADTGIRVGELVAWRSAAARSGRSTRSPRQASASSSTRSRSRPVSRSACIRTCSGTRSQPGRRRAA